MTAKWQAGHTYVPGSLVVPSAGDAPVVFTAQNGDFEEGNTGWDYTGGVQFSSSGGYGSANCCIYPGGGGPAEGEALNKAKLEGHAGLVIKATCMIQQGASDVDHTRGYVLVHFYDDADAEIGLPTKGNVVNDGRGGAWHPSSVTATFPAGAAYARVGIGLYQNSGDPVWGDHLVVSSLVAPIPKGLVYKATQPAPGKSGVGEPVWPGQVGIPVTDNEVIWEGVIATRLVWEASPLLKSGATEPAWPDGEGAMVRDGTIDWEAFTPQAKDAPSSPIVTVGANKVFVGDGDIVRFCATNDAMDWATESDAGYIPTGLWAVGETECTALGIYRGNLTAWTASSMQVWQIDPDPSRMAIIDTVEGAGASYVRSNSGMMNDLFFLSRLGVRSVGITATTGTMGATDVGSPVDTLVRAALAALDAAVDPLTVFYANASQLWQFLGNRAYVYAVSAGSKVYAWSEYTLPWTVTDACVLDGQLYVRTTDHDVFVLDEGRFTDDGANGAATVDYAVEVQWPWLDMGTPGVEKMLDAIDAVLEVGDPAALTGISVGYDERDPAAFTEPLMIGGDTRPGDPVPVPAAAVSLAPKLTHTSDQSWSVSALTLYYVGMGPLR